jgi:NAD+ diphosphatase
MTSDGRETVLAYSGGVIDRAANQRSDPGWIDATLARAGTRLIPMWRDQCVVSGEPAVPAILPAAGADAVLDSAAEVVFLGLDDQGDPGGFRGGLREPGRRGAARGR